MPPHKKPSKKVTSTVTENKLHKAFTAFANDPKTYITENPKKGELIAKMALTMFKGYDELVDLISQFDDREFPNYPYLKYSDSGNNLIGHANNIVDILESLPTEREAASWDETLDEVSTNIHNMMEDTLLEELIEIIDEEPEPNRLVAPFAIEELLKSYFCPSDKFEEMAEKIANEMLLRPDYEFDTQGASEQIEAGIQIAIINALDLAGEDKVELTKLGELTKTLIIACRFSSNLRVNWNNSWLLEYTGR